jgi:maltose alpha-D-glucosyltransferase/alpha-amylase
MSVGIFDSKNLLLRHTIRSVSPAMKHKQVTASVLQDDPLWYKDAVIYEVHVRAFADSNDDGIGDFRGLAEKLEYLQDLGVNTLWLLPFYPSPLRDDGYDIADYTGVNAIYGNLGDFKALLREAHRRGLRVITELVVNHTSDQHPWFQRARRLPPGNRGRDFYVWSDTPDKYKEARIIFSDSETSNWTWDPVAKAYYWHRFYSHQPDLNFDNPAVHEAVFGALDFWLNLGIDGLRLDAVPYLYEREGTICENLPETHAFLKKLRRHLDERFPNRMLLAEANQWPEDAAAYFGNGDECHMAFHFPVMPRLFMAIHMEDRFPIIDILQQTPAIPETCQWALFLRNHDELTLEMVTDEDRDYMYRVYARDSHARINLGIRRRLAPLLENHRARIELMNALLFTLPGTPVVYYGDEIGMGDNYYLGDRNGVRTPMQWNAERNAGFSRTNPQRLFLPVIIDPEYHYQTVNVEAQQNNPHSLLWWFKRLIALRKRSQAFGRGSLEFLAPDNPKVLAFIRRYREETILVVANLSRLMQYVELNLSEHKGRVPVEMFGQTALPPVREAPYLLTLGPYAFYALALELKPAPTPRTAPAAQGVPALSVLGNSWEDAFAEPLRGDLEEILLGYLPAQPWFTRVGGQPESVRFRDRIRMPLASGAPAYITLVDVAYVEDEPRTYVLPLAFAAGSKAREIRDVLPHSVVCRLDLKNGEPGQDEARTGVIYDPLGESDFSAGLLDALGRRRRLRGIEGEMHALPAPAFARLRGADNVDLQPRPIRRKPGYTAMAYGDRLFLKVFRGVEEGINPEVEVAEFLTEHAAFAHMAPLAGTLSYRGANGKDMTLAVFLGFLPSEETAWHHTVSALKRFFTQVAGQPLPSHEAARPQRSLLELLEEKPPALAGEKIGSYLESARLMGQRTAELHLALASVQDNADFAPEPVTAFYQRSLYQTVRTRCLRVIEMLKERLPKLTASEREDASRIVGRSREVLEYFRVILSRRIGGQRIRCHGDYRLNDLLYTGKDFDIIDFEGEVVRPLSTRRRKRPALRDVTSLLYSLQFAVRSELQEETVRPEDLEILKQWARFWLRWVWAAFLRGYFATADQAPLLPPSREERQILLDFYLLRRAVYEVQGHLLYDPGRLGLSLRALVVLLDWRVLPQR